MARAKFGYEMTSHLASILLDRAVPRSERDEIATSRQRDVEGLSRSDALRYAMAHSKKISFDYRRIKDGVESTYYANPYSVRDKFGKRYLYAAERKHGATEIHSFILSRVQRVEVLPNKSFTALWAVEPDTV